MRTMSTLIALLALAGSAGTARADAPALNPASATAPTLQVVGEANALSAEQMAATNAGWCVTYFDGYPIGIKLKIQRGTTCRGKPSSWPIWVITRGSLVAYDPSSITSPTRLPTLNPGLDLAVTTE